MMSCTCHRAAAAFTLLASAAWFLAGCPSNTRSCNSDSDCFSGEICTSNGVCASPDDPDDAGDSTVDAGPGGDADAADTSPDTVEDGGPGDATDTGDAGDTGDAEDGGDTGDAGPTPPQVNSFTPVGGGANIDTSQWRGQITVGGAPPTGPPRVLETDNSEYRLELSVFPARP